MLQGYLSTDPEVRIRSSKKDTHTDYKLTVKGDGTLSRDEFEIFVARDFFDGVRRIIDKPFISKLCRKYQLDGGLILECSHVDAARKSEFMYAEIEFESELQALAFEPPPYLGREVTYDPEYKMKNYWQKTRLA